ncbi:NAD-dependent epimerase/dehydratase family protein [Actinophytocola sp.]|uniref:NAD-dependent epimerase/dehydratase family protein n=1 Tax=Actinophytocola sp. TaxID=1872138 RepID=UPI00389B321C
MATKGRRVVVTGASGNVGTSLVRVLSRDPAVDTIVGIVRRRPEWTVDKLEWATADLGADDSIDHLLAGADVVVHLAWLFQPARDPLTTWETNVLGSIRLFEAVARVGVPALVYSSSVGAYSPAPQDEFVPESWPTHGWPAASYTREKAYLERVLDGFEAKHEDVRVVRLRPAFLFKAASATEQRRLFAGPFLPGSLIRPGLIPVIPDLPGLQAQALHTDDAADAFRLAALRDDASGAYNLAADPVADAKLLAELLGARLVRLPTWAVRGPLAAAWRLRLVPADPDLFDAVLHMPLMDSTRARTELGWTPARDAKAVLSEFLTALREGEGGPTPPLAEDTPPNRAKELTSRAGSRP